MAYLLTIIFLRSRVKRVLICLSDWDLRSREAGEIKQMATVYFPVILLGNLVCHPFRFTKPGNHCRILV